MVDIHNYKRNFERTIEKINEDKDISKENKRVMLEFKDYCLSEGLGIAKINRYLSDLMKFSRMLKKPFKQATEQDLRKVIAELEQTGLAAETKKLFKIMLRKLYRLIYKIKEKNVYPDNVKWISIAIPNNHKKLPEELLTEEEILSMIQACSNIRDKALISTLYEGGCRISEIGTMQIKHVSFEEYGARLHVNGKTGMRKILVINCTPYLQLWLNEHPHNKNPEAYLWENYNAEPLSYARLSAIIKNAAKKAGIKKRVYCHLTRHSRSTALASIMPEASMKQYLGWAQSSKMAGVYIHMSGKDTDEAILRANGIEIKKEKTITILQPVKCLRCHTVNEPTNRFCKLCGLPFNQEEAKNIIKTDTERQQADDIMNKLVQDPEIMELIKKKLQNN